MDSDSYDEEDELYERCGELFLTVKGNFAFHCTLCEKVYKSFQKYNNHILEEHYSSVFSEELTASMSEEDNSFHPPSEEDVELIVNEDEKIIVYPKENKTNIADEVDISNKGPYDFDELDAEKENLPEIDFAQSLKPDSIELSMRPNEETIKTHLRTINVKPTITNRKYKCPHCGFSGADRANMKKHIKRHSTNKPHQCTECPKAFHSRTELQTHLRTHTGERPYLCTLCGQAFTTSSKLSGHQKRHNNARDKECPICKMRFFGTHSLREHMAVHSEKRDYKCEHCDASFKLPLGLKNHMKLHENKRKYQCKLCKSRFNQYAGLYSHMKRCHLIVLNASKGPI